MFTIPKWVLYDILLPTRVYSHRYQEFLLLESLLGLCRHLSQAALAVRARVKRWMVDANLEGLDRDDLSPSGLDASKI